MRFLVPALLLAASPASARPADWRASNRVVVGAGRYAADDLEAGVLLPSARWEMSARVKTVQDGDAYRGDLTEYSARLARHLPHVSIAGRLGTAPPDSQRLSYHLASGEVLMTWYGTTLGPAMPERVATVAEDTTTAAALSGLDRTWVTRAACVYTNTAFHRSAHAAAERDFRLAQNSWQFTVSETWKGVATLALHGGGHRYSRALHPSDPSWRHWNLDYEAAPFAVAGFENQYLGADAEGAFGDFRARAGLARVNMLSGRVLSMTGVEAAWRPRGGRLEASAGFYTTHLTREATMGAVSAGLSGRW
ncbi:MAG: hypothetical protein HY079_14025 [Elusimicrobia bacterium]|nr:hypothetical protein [Elusimicrobiota bacterium]